MKLLKTDPKAFSVKVGEVAPAFNLVLIITLASIGVLAALMQFVILPRVAKKLHDEDK